MKTYFGSIALALLSLAEIGRADKKPRGVVGDILRQHRLKGAARSLRRSDGGKGGKGSKGGGMGKKANGTGIDDDLGGNELSAFAEMFIAQSFVFGGVTEETNEAVVVETDEGQSYEVTANITTVSSGIVMLANSFDLIERVSCGTGGPNNTSITIQFKESVSPTKTATMFPRGAVVVSTKDYFGRCFITGTLLEEDLSGQSFQFNQDLFRNITDAGDGYVIIESVSLLEDDTVIVNGPRGYFFSMFEDGLIMARRTNTTNARRHLVSIDLDSGDLLPNPFLKMRASGSLGYEAEVSVMEANFGLWGFEFNLRVEDEITLSANLDTSFDVGISQSIPVYSKSLISIPIGPPALKLLSLVKKIGFLKKFVNSPDFKIGPYAELPLLIQVRKALLTREFGPYVDFDFTTGRRVTDFSARFIPAAADIGISRTVVQNPGHTFDLDAGTKALQEDGTLSLELFAGFRPRTMIYLSELIAMGIGINIGAEFAAKYSLEADSFPPLPQQFGVIQKGSCDTCHDFEADLSQLVESPSFQAYIKVNITILGYKPKLWKLDIPLIPGAPTLRNKILSICALESEDGTCISNAPTGTPSQLIPTITGGRLSGVFGDPHLSTFDRLRFDCQAGGEFIMLTSLENPDFKIQERFSSVTSGSCSQASISTAIAIQEPGIGLFQLSIPKTTNLTEPQSTVDTGLALCPVDFLIDGNRAPLGPQTNTEIELSISGPRLQLTFLSTGVQIRSTITFSTTFGCHMAQQVFIPFTYRSGETLLGLLGTPNGRRNDDWISPNGAPYIGGIPTTASQLAFGDAYMYCTTQWCVQEEQESIFIHLDEAFGDINECNSPYSSTIEMMVQDAIDRNDTVISFCGQENLVCVIDGLCGSLEDSRAAVQDEADLVEAQEAANPSPVPTMSPAPSESTSPSFTKPTASILRTCVAIIDETNNGAGPDSFYDSQWQEFRQKFPQRNFCLVRVESRFPVYVPQAMLSDNRTIVVPFVTPYDDADTSRATDWFHLCRLDEIPPAITNVAVFEDTSSLPRSRFQASFDLFERRIRESGLEKRDRMDNSENYIAPFIDDLF